MEVDQDQPVDLSQKQNGALNGDNHTNGKESPDVIMLSDSDDEQNVPIPDGECSSKRERLEAIVERRKEVVRKLKAELRNEESKLILFKKIRMSQQGLNPNLPSHAQSSALRNSQQVPKPSTNQTGTGGGASNLTSSGLSLQQQQQHGQHGFGGNTHLQSVTKSTQGLVSQRPLMASQPVGSRSSGRPMMGGHGSSIHSDGKKRSGYQLFTIERLPQFASLQHKERMTAIGRLWNSLGDIERNKYNKRAESIDKARSHHSLHQTVTSNLSAAAGPTSLINQPTNRQQQSNATTAPPPHHSTVSHQLAVSRSQGQQYQHQQQQGVGKILTTGGSLAVGANKPTTTISIVSHQQSQAQQQQQQQIRQQQQQVLQNRPSSGAPKVTTLNVPKISLQELAQKQAMNKIALRKNLEKTLLQIQPQKPTTSDLNFVPSLASPDFLFLLGLEDVVKAMLNQGHKSDVKYVFNPFTCVQCGTDFTPVWKRDKPGSKDVICEICVSVNQKKAIRQEYKNRLKSAFFKALQQEQDMEKVHQTQMQNLQQQIQQHSSTGPSASTAAAAGASASSVTLNITTPVAAHTGSVKTGRPISYQIQHPSSASSSSSSSSSTAPNQPSSTGSSNASPAAPQQRQYLLDMIPSARTIGR